MIQKHGSGWRVVSHTGKNLGTFPSRTQAVKRLRQVEFFKHHRRTVGR